MKIEMPSAANPVTAICADSLRVLPLLPRDCVDMVIADPPYSSGGIHRNDRIRASSDKYQHGDTQERHECFGGESRDQRGWLAWSTLWMSDALAVTKPSGFLVVFTDWRQLPTTTDAMQAAGWVWRGVAVWDKKNAIPQPNTYRQQCEFIVWGTKGKREPDYDGGAYVQGCFTHTPPRDRGHATEKPVGIMADLISLCVAGGLVLDPFGGTGPVAVAAITSGRMCIIIDENPNFHKVTVERIEEALAARKKAEVADSEIEAELESWLAGDCDETK